MNIQTVKEFEFIYLINDSISIPKDPKNSEYQRVLDFIADGGVVEQEDLLQKAKDSKISKIEGKASSLITTPYPIYTQLNYLAEVSTIQDKQIKGETITQDELDFLEQAKGVKAFINGIRDQAKAFVLQVNDESHTTADDINNIDITFI